jgi:hypothetical protein
MRELITDRGGNIMWMFSKEGFFSVVQNDYCSSGELAVRTRIKKDLVRFCNATKTDKAGILKTPDADYRFRIHVPRSTWAAYAAKAAGEIDYPNFKNAACSCDPARSRVYHECWENLYEWQNKSGK